MFRSREGVYTPNLINVRSGNYLFIPTHHWFDDSLILDWSCWGVHPITFNPQSMNHPMIHLCRLLGSILLESILRYFIRAETWGFGLSIKKLGQVRESILLESRLGSFNCLSKSGSLSSVLQIILKSHPDSIFAKSASFLPYMELVLPYMVREHENWR